MFHYFLVEDEGAVRSALRRTLSWETQGFSCAGEASDGEMALPILRRSPPDLLVTDLHMPYLDGLELCRHLRREFPQTKLLLLSASATQQELESALFLGVDGFLSKPVDHVQFSQIISRLRTELEQECAEQAELEELRERSASWEESLQEQFLLRMLEGTQSLRTLHSEAQSLGLNLHAQRYCILMCSARPLTTDKGVLSELEEAHRELKLFFHRSPRLFGFAWHPAGFNVLVLADEGAIEREVSFCVQNIRNRLLPLGEQCRWVVAIAEPVNRLHSLRSCYDQAREVLAWSHLVPEQHVLTPDNLQAIRQGKLEPHLRALPTPVPLSRDLELFLEMGTREQVREFAGKCADSLGEGAMEVPKLCLYVLLQVRLATVHYMVSLGLDPADLLSAVDSLPGIDLLVGRLNVIFYLTTLLNRAVELREEISQTHYHATVQQGMRLIAQQYADPKLSLSSLAQAVGVTPNYFSSLFRREVGISFSSYLTQQRMARARELLRSTDLSSAEVGKSVGYRDARYFSTQFRKTQGCTPREYRAGERKKD